MAAGTYTIEGVADFFGTNKSMLRLYNVTDTAVEFYGTTTYAGASIAGFGQSHLRGAFTLATNKTVRVEYRVGSTAAGSGLGHPASFGVNEVYGLFVLKRVA